MNTDRRELVVIGGGPAGMAAAISAKESGVEDILIIDREYKPGGILKQCIHDGFGLHKFKKVLTGPEYAHKYIKRLEEHKIEINTKTLVTNLSQNKIITAYNSSNGMFKVKADAVILAMGSREKTAGAIQLAGTRPSGIYTAGLVQKLINMKNIMVGKEAVILGSGDVGLIMARRMALEGVKVKAVLEIMPHASGLPRNINQCLKDYSIPLKLNHTIVEIEGQKRIKSIIAAKVDDKLRPIPNTKEEIICDTLILSVGLIPENELSRQAGIFLDNKTGGPLVKNNLETNIPGIFAAGNVLHIHDVVDYVSEEASRAGRFAADFLKNKSLSQDNYLSVVSGKGVKYIVPQLVKTNLKQKIYFRPNKPITNPKVVVRIGNEICFSEKFKALHPSIMQKVILPETSKSTKAKFLEVAIE